MRVMREVERSLTGKREEEEEEMEVEARGERFEVRGDEGGETGIVGSAIEVVEIGSSGSSRALEEERERGVRR